MRCRCGIAVVLCAGAVISGAAQTMCGAPSPAVASFVHQGFIHGVQASDVAKFHDDADIDELVCMLGDSREEFYHRNIVTLLGISNNIRATKPLIAFIESGNGALSKDEYSAKSDALISLGYLAAIDPEAMAYLKARTEPRSWDSVGLRWSAPSSVENGTEGNLPRNMDLAKHAILGLGVSGQDSAASFLSQLSKGDTAQVRSDFSQVIAQALVTIQEKHKPSDSNE